MKLTPPELKAAQVNSHMYEEFPFPVHTLLNLIYCAWQDDVDPQIPEPEMRRRADVTENLQPKA